MNNNELSNNEKNEREYNELVKENAVNRDNYYDKNSPITKIVLLVLGLIIVIGLIIICSIAL